MSIEPTPSPTAGAAMQAPGATAVGAARSDATKTVVDRLFGPSFTDTVDSVQALQKQLREALHSTEEAVRKEAAVRLLRLDRATLLSGVQRRLSSSNSTVAKGAAELLGRARLKDAVPSLMSAFRSQREDVAEAIAESLGDIGDALAVPALCTALDTRFVATAAAIALGKLDDPRALGSLLRGLNSSSDALRIASARSLGLIRRRNRHAHPAEQRAAAMVAPQLREALTDDVAEVRVNAALALWTLGERHHAKLAVAELRSLLVA